jgi:methyl-accepting chemotaxis protein
VQANSLWGAMTFSNVGIGRKFAAGFACILVAVALTSATLFVIMKSLDAAALDNERSHKVVDDLQRAVNAVSEQARTARGYIIARDEHLPLIYDAAVKDFAANMAQLRGDITGRPELLSLIDKVEMAGANWRNEVGDPMIRLTRDNPTSEKAAEVSKSARSTELFTAVKSQVQDALNQAGAWSAASPKNPRNRTSGLVPRAPAPGAASGGCSQSVPAVEHPGSHVSLRKRSQPG